jgi:hypothetical protein
LIEIPMASGAMDIFIVHPSDPGTYPAVIIYMDVWGLREELFDIACRHVLNVVHVLKQYAAFNAGVGAALVRAAIISLSCSATAARIWRVRRLPVSISVNSACLGGRC